MGRLALVVSMALVFAPLAAPQTRVPGIPAPRGLRAFELRADEPIGHTYPRTPSFSWQPVAAKGGHYDFELATSETFEDSSIVFKDTRVPIPAEAVARQLPWLTGDPYALWAHVRWVSNDGQRASPWSVPFGLNLQWRAQDVPQQLPAPEGLVRWKPIDGATGYEVLYPDLVPAKSFETTTNVADEREFFTFHNALGYGTIHWRVRAIRTLNPADTATNGLPAVSYGPWSPVFTTVNAPQTAGTLTPTDTVSDAWDTGKTAHAHELTPGFAWTPSAPVISQGIDPGSSLYRVYIFTDKDCVNRVFTGSIVGSPAYAPRTEGGPMPLPGDTAALTLAESAPPFLTGPGSEGNAVDATGDPVSSNESAGSQVGAAGAEKPSGSAGLAGVDLWDSGWPSGRYYWTVVPVSAEVPSFNPATTDPTKGLPITYHDMAVPQDSCQAGLGMSFGKTSQPVVTADGAPYVSGVSPSGRTIAAAARSTPAVYESPLVAWQPAVGASRYQIQLSRRLYPWSPAKTLSTDATSIVLPLSKSDAGTWYYRVRGVDDSLPVGAQKMSWSQVVALKVTGDRFTLVK
jgi:hypothetical protein